MTQQVSWGFCCSDKCQQRKLGEERVYFRPQPTLRGSQGRNPEARTEAEVREGCGLLPCFPGLLRLLLESSQDHLLGWPRPQWVESSNSCLQSRKCSQTCCGGELEASKDSFFLKLERWLGVKSTVCSSKGLGFNS